MERKKIVLVLDAEAASSRLVSSALREEYAVFAAVNADDGIRQLKEHTPDLILLDPTFPGASDLCSAVKSQARIADSPVVLLADPCHGLTLFGLEASDYIAKPIAPDLLRVRLRNCLALKEQRDLVARQKDELGQALAEQAAVNRLLQRDWEHTFSSVLDHVSLIDTSHTIVRVNSALAECRGVAPEELAGRKCYEVMHGADEPPASCPLLMMLDDGGVHRKQVVEQPPRRVFDVTVSPRYDAGGALIGCVHVARDITARVMTEAYGSTGQDILRVLSETESQKEGIERVLALVKAATGVDAVGIRLQDEDDFPYFYQEGFSQDFLTKEHSLLARTTEGGICRDSCGNVCLECTCGLVITGKTDGCPGSTSGGSFWTNDSFPFLHMPAGDEVRTHPRNECIHHGFASVALIPIRAKGRIVGLLQLNAVRKGCFTQDGIETLEGIAKNIGEALLRKQAEEKLIANERFLRTLTDQIPGMVGYWDDELRCTFANRAYIEWFGMAPEEMVGITMQELMGEELFAKNEPYIRSALRGEAQRFERTLVKPCGDIGYTWAHYIPDLVDGTARGFFVLVSDVTELKGTQEEKVKLQLQLQQAQKMESIGRLAGGVAHDFNNMLSVIVGRAELSLLQMKPHDATYDDLLEIRDAAERSANLTRQLLAFARKQTISPKVMDVNETVSGMLKMLQRLIGEGIDLNWLPDPALWRVKADPGQIDQILANLCVNSRDSIAKTGVITIRTSNSTLDSGYCKDHPDALPGDYVRLSVTDDGCGMERETLEKVFEPFYTTKELGTGTGLGLATVFGIVKQNRGSITVESVPGEGTTFSIYLPRLEEQGSKRAAEVATVSFPKGRETVLLVEDEQAILSMTAIMLGHQGYTVLAAATPDEAIQLAREHAGEIHLLLTDVVMPKMNGRDLASILLGSYPAMKCLFMSGYTADVIAQHGVLDEKVHFMQKPFTFPDLAAKVRDALDA